MIKYSICTKNDLKDLCLLWNETVKEDGFFKQYTIREYEAKMMSNPEFSLEGTFIAKEKDVLVGFIIGVFRQDIKNNDDIPGYINAIVVKKRYRRQGIGTQLLHCLNQYFFENDKIKMQASYYLPSCYSWFVPETRRHDHPCAPGVRINSSEYFFLLAHGYEVIDFEDAFHLSLANYEFPNDINDIIKKNKKDGIEIELYNPEKHYGLEQFYQELKIYDFEKVIRANLLLEKPYPFLVIAKQGKVLGWTGAMWNEESGRAHFDGIAILSSVRGRGLGKALFASLALKSKENGAKFMTFYTGFHNHARYIYLGAGFKIVQTFAIMRKKIK